MSRYPRSIGGINDLQHMVDELGEQNALKLLDVHRTTLRRWLAGKTHVPRNAVLALMWETRYGRAIIDGDHEYELRLIYGHIDTLTRENHRLVEALQELERLRQFDSANTPIRKFEKMSVWKPFGKS